jgi:hypothetical protein
MQPGGAQIGKIGLQDVEDVGRLVEAAADGAAEERDVVVGDVPIGDPALCHTGSDAQRGGEAGEALENGELPN